MGTIDCRTTRQLRAAPNWAAPCASFGDSRLQSAEESDSVFDVGNGIRRFTAFDRNPPAIVEFREETEKFGKIGGPAAEFNFSGAAGGHVANGVARVNMQDVRTQ